MWIALDRDPYQRNVQILIALFVGLSFIMWLSVRDVRSQWLNVPPIPSQFSIKASVLSDDSLAYRMIGIMLQNLGDTGGRTTSLHNYDTTRLKDWFLLEHTLDPHSNYIPALAAHYFGAVQQEYAPQKLGPVIDYLEVVGTSGVPGKWRWLAQAVSLARFSMHDYERAYALSLKLARLADEDSTIPNWARAMPAFVRNQQGDKEGAKNIILAILGSVAKGEIKIHPEEINHMRDVVCNRLMTPQEVAEAGDLCKNIP
ncbi:MAG: hypothetical protein L6Q57_05630 [Alphaproteobacteria bacterium]|nr:hypothetical protein [Alphaproteobacteria bacterium]